MAKKEIKFYVTAFRDGFQSVYGARVLSKDFMPAVEAFLFKQELHILNQAAEQLSKAHSFTTMKMLLM